VLGQFDNLDRLATSASRGGIPGLDAEPYRTPAADWWGEMVTLRLLEGRQQIGDRKLSLLNGKITVASRTDNFTASVSLSGGVPVGVRGADTDPLMRWLSRPDMEVLDFGTLNRGGGAATVIELTDIQHPEALERDPLKLHLDVELAEDELLQAYVHDGEHLLPVGEMVGSPDSLPTLRISQLPVAAVGEQRSVLGAVRMIIQKVVLRQESYTLRYVDYTGLEARRTKANLREKVARAGSVLVLIHGIIGDTLGMAEFARQLVADGDVNLVLTFDYENLLTPLEETSEKLKKALEEDAGLRKDQHLVILAHSMGGLVARNYIENWKGARYVDRLVMAGTPNAGSEIAKYLRYRKYAICLLGFAMNYGWAPGAVSLLLAGLERSKWLTPTLEQMDPSSPFVKSLAMAPDPGIPYHIVGGDLNDYVLLSSFDRTLKNKLIRLGGQLIYGEMANDVAVSLASIHSVDAERSPAVAIHEIPCHHMNYFVEPGSAAVLRSCLTATHKS
ncbi:MAG: hypothetical protein WA952_01745, partial [Lewinella sp.]